HRDDLRRGAAIWVFPETAILGRHRTKASAQTIAIQSSLSVQETGCDTASPSSPRPRGSPSTTQQPPSHEQGTLWKAGASTLLCQPAGEDCRRGRPVSAASPRIDPSPDQWTPVPCIARRCSLTLARLALELRIRRAHGQMFERTTEPASVV